MRRSGFEIDAAEEEANKNGEEDEDTQNTIHEVIGLVIYQLLVLGVFLQGTAPLLTVRRAKEGLQSVEMVVSGADSFIRVYDLQWWPSYKPHVQWFTSLSLFPDFNRF